VYNQVYLIGRLTTKPEVVELNDNKKVLIITLAVQRSYKNSDGIYEADFIKCVLWDGIADRTAEYCQKGDLVAVRGQVRTSSYLNEAEEKKYVTEILVDKISFLATKNNSQEAS
jgi:single-strand DNA-binding protein